MKKILLIFLVSLTSIICLSQINGYTFATGTSTSTTITITFNANGGTLTGGTTSTGKTISYNSNYSVGTIVPTRSGYTFAGWYTASTGGSLATWETKFTTNTTLYAHWTANNITITFNANGGTFPWVPLITITEKIISSDNNYYSAGAVEPTRSGYTFAGWYTASTGGSLVTMNSRFTTNTTLYAHWTANNITITFNANGGTFTGGTTSTGKTISYNSNYSVGTIVPTRSGYTFADWYTASNGGSLVTMNSKFTTNTTLYAHWTANNIYYDTIRNLYHNKINGLSTSKLEIVLGRITVTKANFEIGSDYYLILEALEQIINEIIESRSFDLDSLFE